ncbi:MAG: hypothetical protein OEX97_05175 [Acidimicrobiia bacterium]|nr:hypothetical protein [Acidimicrobiia bacterium]
MKRRSLFAIVILLTLVLAACAAGANPQVDVAAGDGDLAGFWLGLWHGIILPFTFIISLFSDNVNVYEVFNSGGWYNFGFVMGAGVFLGGSSRTKRRKR